MFRSNRGSGVTVTVPGIGALAAAAREIAKWPNMVRASVTGLATSQRWKFLRSVSGRDGIGTRIHTGGSLLQ